MNFLSFQKVWVVSLVVFLASLFSHPVSAQNITDLLAGDGDGTDLEKRGIIALEQVNRRLKDTKQFLDKNQTQKLQETITKQLKSLQELIIQYQSYPEQRRWRRDAEILKLRAGIVFESKSLSKALIKLQTTYSSIEQNHVRLRTILLMYIDARKNLKGLLTKKYPIQKRSALKRLMTRIQKRLKKRERVLKTNAKALKKLNHRIQKNQRILEKVRKRMLNPPAARRPVPRRVKPKVPVPKKKKQRRRRRRRRRQKKKDNTPPPLTTAQRRKIERKKKYEQRLEFLTNTFRRQKFAHYRSESIYLRVRKEDEEFEREIHRDYASLYHYMIDQMSILSKLYSAKAEGGLLHYKPFDVRQSLFAQVTSHTTIFVAQSYKQANGLWQVAMKAATNFQKKNGLTLLILILLIPFGLIGFALFLRSILAKFSHKMIERMNENTEGRQLWEVLHLFALLTLRLLLFSAFFGGLILVSQVLGFPKAWERMFWTIGTTVIVLRGLWLLANQLLADDPERRVLKVFDDDLTRRFRRTIKWLSGFALFYMPFLELIRVLEYPAAFYDLCNAGFYAVIWFGAVLSFMRKMPPVELEEDAEPADTLGENKETNHRRWSLILGYRVYPLLLLSATAIFIIYMWGFRNLASYLGRAVLLTIFFLSISSTLYQGLKALVFWIFGLNDKSKGLIKVSTQVAFYISRFSRVSVGILLAFFTLGLILEAWQVPGGFKAIIKLINFPFLSIKGTRLSFLSMVKFVLVFGSSLWFSGWLKERLSKSIYPIFRMTPGGEHASNTVVNYVVVIVGLLAGLQVMGMSIGVLAVFAGVIGIGVGFGLQNIASNFISGLIITFGRPVAVGNVIEVGGVYGVVRKISARSITLETKDNRIILIPNSDIISSQVINWSLGSPYVWATMSVGVSYGSDIELVKRALLEIAVEHPAVLENPPPDVLFVEFGASSLDFVLEVAIRELMGKPGILSQLRFATNKKFDELDIEMPFPQQDLSLDGSVIEVMSQMGDYFGQIETGEKKA